MGSPRPPAHPRVSSHSALLSSPPEQYPEDVQEDRDEIKSGMAGNGASNQSEDGGDCDSENGRIAGMSNLDNTLERIGFGRYQKRLLILCGFGWMADNMWLQSVAVILPRVQGTPPIFTLLQSLLLLVNLAVVLTYFRQCGTTEHFQVSDRWIGALSASIFAGMMIGAWLWGSYSDTFGRTPAFNGTLLLTSIFGLFAGFAPSFAWLCVALFLLGIGVGGSMPTDGTLFLENTPKTHHYLLTGLSFFFSLGAVLSSVLGLAILPGHSCPEVNEGETAIPCDVEKENTGWRLILGALGVLTLAMFIARIFFFKLQESPKFLVTSGRPEEAVIVLHRITKINGVPLRLNLADVDDKQCKEEDEDRDRDIERGTSGRMARSHSQDYAAVESGGRTDNGYLPVSTEDEEQNDWESRENAQYESASARAEGKRRRRSISVSIPEGLPRPLTSAIDSIVGGTGDYFDRVSLLFAPEWKKTTIIVWIIWTFVSASYTMFNVFLPKYLETKLDDAQGGGGRYQSLVDYVFYAVAGCPGSIAGAYFIETSLGRKGTMAASTLATSAGLFLFVNVGSQTWVVLSSMFVSFMATLMYAVIYGYTPEVFEPSVRGTACGIASALSRLAGIAAPMLTGVLLSISTSLPLFVSACGFLACAACMVTLPIETRVAKKT